MLTRHRPGRAARRVAAVVLATALSAALASTPAAGQAGDWSAVDQALGRKGAAQPGAVIKYSFPRSDLQVMVNGVQLKPALALGSWIAFRRIGASAMMMGDLVLAEDEVAPVVRALQRGGVEQTALHNHLLGESPRVMYVHVMGHGDAATLAAGLRAALDRMAVKRSTTTAGR